MNRQERLTRDGAIDPILFYAPEDPWGCFSNFSRHPVILPSPWTWKPVEYPTSEHRYQAMKAVRAQDHDHILSHPGPGGAKQAGREIRLREDWGDTVNSVCYFVMLEVCLAKTFQHVEVTEAVMDTADRYLYEDSPVDDIWGWRYHASYTGKNLLGLVWMQVRDMLQPVL